MKAVAALQRNLDLIRSLFDTANNATLALLNRIMNPVFEAAGKMPALRY